MTRRLVTTYLALTLLILLALEVPLAINYQDRQRKELAAAIERDAFVISSYVEDILNGTAPNKDLSSIAAGYSNRTGGRVVIVDATGTVLTDSDPTVSGPRSFASRPEISAALDQQIATGTRHSNTLGTDLLYVAVPVTSGGKVYGAVRITYSTQQLDARVRRYWLLLGGVALVSLAAAGAMGALLARWVTRPVAELRRAATRIGDGELDARAEVDTGPPEVRELAAAFNATAVRLQQLVTAQEQFVADASHQLRTPLTALRLRLEVLEEEADPATAEDVEAARNEVQRLSRLVDGLLALARAERAPGPASPTPSPLGPLLEERRATWEPVAAERDVALEATADGLRARVNPDHLVQMLDNLVANALEASPPGGTIRLWAEPADDAQVCVHVTDQGPGMTPEQRERAFDRFWRARTTRSQLGGSGLGLAIVQKLAEAEGGRAELREAAGGGLDACLLLHR